MLACAESRKQQGGRKGLNLKYMFPYCTEVMHIVPIQSTRMRDSAAQIKLQNAKWTLSMLAISLKGLLTFKNKMPTMYFCEHIFPRWFVEFTLCSALTHKWLVFPGSELFNVAARTVQGRAAVRQLGLCLYTDPPEMTITFSTLPFEYGKRFQK